MTKKIKEPKKDKKITKKTNKKYNIKINIEPLMRISKNDCKPFLDKEGKIIRSNKKIDRNYRDLICVLKGKKKFDKMYFPFLYGNENTILKKLLLIKKAQDNDLKYFKEKKINSNVEYPDENIYIFKNENLKNSLYMIFLHYFLKNKDESFYRDFYPKDETKEENIIKYFATLGINYKLTYININNEEILTLLFYLKYIFFIQKELIKKYGYKLKDFKNYQQLYLFLKVKGYVKIFFDKYGPKIVKLIPILIKKINSHPLFKTYVDNIRLNDVKSFRDLSIYDLIDEYLPEYLDKKKIWNIYKNLT